MQITFKKKSMDFYAGRIVTPNCETEQKLNLPCKLDFNYEDQSYSRASQWYTMDDFLFCSPITIFSGYGRIQK
jgi:hypothetical protein